MARQEGNTHPQRFVEEIDFNEIETFEVKQILILSSFFQHKFPEILSFKIDSVSKPKKSIHSNKINPIQAALLISHDDYNYGNMNIM